MQFRHSLDINEDEDYLSRRRLAAKDPEMQLIRNAFDAIRDSALKKAGYSLHIAETCNNPEKQEIITNAGSNL